MEATIRADRNVTTLVNILNVEPENQQALAAVLKESIETFFSKMPGCISSSVLTGKNGRQVISYSQWRSPADIEAFRQILISGPPSSGYWLCQKPRQSRATSPSSTPPDLPPKSCGSGGSDRPSLEGLEASSKAITVDWCD